MNLQVLDLGLIDYSPAWKLQDEYAAEIAAGTRPPTLLLLEHPHTFTFGRKGQTENLLWSPDELIRRGVSIHWVDRGGDVTYHGPGQLVGYPLLPLTPISYLADSKEGRIPDADYVGYIRKIETALIAALARLGLVTGQRSGLTGVWVQADVHSRCPRCRPEDRAKPAKVAAIGVKVDARGVTRHGFALNVNPDMEYWEGIVACGLSEPVAALADLLSPVPTMERVKAEVAEAFREKFELDEAKLP
ncbi:MAG TPA: lipoyl(octanoyl) transferase LipB [Anaerolineales bacterium]|nr:lipoyl(octanoyl) transferase LipB [Anaerolineales bacterium]